RTHGADGSGATIELSGEPVQVVGADGLKLDGLEGMGGKIGDELKKRLGGIGNGLALRMLPEKDRWEKARTELGLQDYQVENLKKAVADRDAAMKDAMQVETTTQNDSSTIRVRHPDPEKLTAANKEYDRKLSETLDQDHKKKWDEK